MKTRRRDFIKYSLLGSAALLSGIASLVKAGALDGIKVTVVGAGCSGLVAARALADSGAQVTVVEAKPQIGGRLLTDWSMGAPFEVGAGWIHGPEKENPTRQLADAVAAQYFVTDDDSLTVFDPRGNELSEAELAKLNKQWASALVKIDNNLETSDSRSLQKVLANKLKDQGLEWAMSAYTEFSLGGPLDDLSAVLFDEGNAFETEDVIVTTGYDQLLKPLAKGLSIKLSTVVTDIEYSAQGAKIQTNQGDIHCDYVICSAPLGTLKAEKIKFNPELPQNYRENIKKIGFGSVTKIALKFDQAFWDPDTQYFGMMTSPKGRWNYWINYKTFSNENILLGLSVGDYAKVADSMSDTQIQADALQVLENVWGKEVSLPTQMLRTQWSKDTFSLGAYAYPTPGQKPHQFDDLSEPVADRLLLCGEHTIFDYMGTTHGACLSGLRAAEYVLENES